MVWREKGTDIIKMILEQGTFFWPGYNRTRQPAGEPCWEAMRCVENREHRGDGTGPSLGSIGGRTQSTHQRA